MGPILSPNAQGMYQIEGESYYIGDTIRTFRLQISTRLEQNI